MSCVHSPLNCLGAGGEAAGAGQRPCARKRSLGSGRARESGDAKKPRTLWPFAYMHWIVRALVVARPPAASRLRRNVSPRRRHPPPSRTRSPGAQRPPASDTRAFARRGGAPLRPRTELRCPPPRYFAGLSAGAATSKANQLHRYLPQKSATLARAIDVVARGTGRSS